MVRIYCMICVYHRIVLCVYHHTSLIALASCSVFHGLTRIAPLNDWALPANSLNINTPGPSLRCFQYQLISAMLVLQQIYNNVRSSWFPPTVQTVLR
jgi:hypothetical protein